MSANQFAQLVRCSDYPAIVTALATAKSGAEIVTLLTQPDEDGHSALHWAAMSDHQQLMKNIIPFVRHTSVDVRSHATAQANQTPLHWACIAGNVASVRALLDAGADPALEDNKGYNAPIHAAQYGHIDVLHVLIAVNNSLKDSFDHTGNTLVQWAAYYNHYPAVRYLTAVHDLSPNTPDNSNTTALHRAVRSDRFLVVDVLMRAGADVRGKDGRDRTPYQLALPHSHSAKLLQEWLSDIRTVEHPHPSRHTLSRHALVLFYYLVIIFSYFFYFTFVMTHPVLPPAAHIVSHLCIITSVASHLRATFRDPGDIQPGTKEQFILYIEQAVARGDSAIRLLPSAYCYTCLAERPPRSKHSRERDVCVRLFDHECPWVNNTVGLYTHKSLLALVASTAIVEFLFIYGVVRIFVSESARQKVPFLVTIWQHHVISLLVLLNTVVAIFCSVLFVTHVCMIAQGMTTYEYITSEPQNKNSGGTSERSACQNILSFLTLTGPGTGNPYVPITLSSLLSFILSTGNSDARKKVSSDLPDVVEGQSLMNQQSSDRV